MTRRARLAQFVKSSLPVLLDISGFAAITIQCSIEGSCRLLDCGGIIGTYRWGYYSCLLGIGYANVTQRGRAAAGKICLIPNVAVTIVTRPNAGGA